MKFWKFGIAISLTTAFCLMACEESTSANDNETNSEYKPGTVACSVTQQNPYVQKTKMDDYEATMTLTLEDNVMVQLMEYNMKVPQDTCKHYQNNPNYDVTCNETSIKIVDKTKMEASEFESMTTLFASACKSANGKKIQQPAKDENGKVTLPEIEECNADNKDKEIEVIKGSEIFVVCNGDKWVPSKVTCSTNDKKVDLTAIALTCTDGKWTLDTGSKCEDGKTEKKSFMDVEVSASCANGVWQIDEPKAAAEDEAKTEENE